MSDQEPPEKRTVKLSDELLQKSRRLIDELEFILDKLKDNPQRAHLKSGGERREKGDVARSD